MLVLGFNGSPYKDGIVAKLLDSTLKAAEAEGAEVETIHLYDLEIEMTPGLYSRDPTLERPENMPKDDLFALHERILAADAYVFATPVYWNNMSGVMKNFIDRLTPFENVGYLLEGKIGCVIAASKEGHGGAQLAALNLLAPLLVMGLIIPAYGSIWAPRGAEDAGTSIEDTRIVGANLVRMHHALKDADLVTDPAHIS